MRCYHLRPTLELTPEQIDALKNAFGRKLTGWQRAWSSTRNVRQRNLYKGNDRKIGMSWYLCCESLLRALETGQDFIYMALSEDHARALVYALAAFVNEHTGAQLKRTEIILSNGAKLRFVSMNRKTLAGFSGHVVIDEVLTLAQYVKIKEIAQTIASHRQHTITTVWS